MVTQFAYQNSEIYNIDETGLPFEMAPYKIIIVKGAKRALIKSKDQTKQKVTGLFLIRTDGIKWKPLIVFKGTPKRRIEREGKLFNNWNIACCIQTNIWFDSEVLKIWIKKVFKQTFPNQKKLIIMDNFCVHTDHVELIEYNQLIKILFLPP